MNDDTINPTEDAPVAGTEEEPEEAPPEPLPEPTEEELEAARLEAERLAAEEEKEREAALRIAEAEARFEAERVAEEEREAVAEVARRALAETQVPRATELIEHVETTGANRGEVESLLARLEPEAVAKGRAAYDRLRAARRAEAARSSRVRVHPDLVDLGREVAARVPKSSSRPKRGRGR